MIISCKRVLFFIFSIFLYLYQQLTIFEIEWMDSNGKLMQRLSPAAPDYQHHDKIIMKNKSLKICIHDKIISMIIEEFKTRMGLQ